MSLAFKYRLHTILHQDTVFVKEKYSVHLIYFIGHGMKDMGQSSVCSDSKFKYVTL